MANEYDDLNGEDMDSLISAIENGSDKIGTEGTDDNDNEADLEDTIDTEDTEVETDTGEEADDAESDTDDETADDVDEEDAQAEEDDVDVDEDESDGTTPDDDLDDDTDGVDDEIEEDELEDDGSTDGDDDEDIEDEDDTDETDTGEGEAELDEFYRQAQDVEFMVNGKKVKGLGTIDDMVKARQMAGGLNEKFKAIKELRPFLAPLKDRGLIDNPEKFNLAMQIIDGDKDALKQFMLDGGIDPLDMDMDTVNYEARNSLASNEEIIYNDTLDVARQYGVEDRFNKVVLNEWDSASLAQFFATNESAATIGTALAAQIENGIYDEVMTEVANLESRDVNGTFGVKSSIDKYNEASNIVNARNAGAATRVTETKKSSDEVAAAKVEAAKKKITEKRKKEAYTKKLEENNKQADAKRKKASAASQAKTKVAPAKKADPYSLEGDDLDSFVSELMHTFR